MKVHHRKGQMVYRELIRMINDMAKDSVESMVQQRRLFLCCKSTFKSGKGTLVFPYLQWQHVPHQGWGGIRIISADIHYASSHKHWNSKVAQCILDARQIAQQLSTIWYDTNIPEYVFAQLVHQVEIGKDVVDLQSAFCDPAQLLYFESRWIAVVPDSERYRLVSWIEPFGEMTGPPRKLYI